MTTQSKSVLLPFLIIAALLFAAALGWKLFGSDEQATTNQTAVVEKVEATQTEVAETTQAKPEEVTVLPDPKPYLADIPTDKKAAKKQASNHMKMAMRYQTAEQALNALKNFHEQGNQDMVDMLLDFMARSYPNTAIPAEILD